MLVQRTYKICSDAQLNFVLTRNPTRHLRFVIGVLNKLLLGNLKANHEWVILPSSQSKIKKKNTLFIDQSAFSNFALYVIILENMYEKPVVKNGWLF